MTKLKMQNLFIFWIAVCIFPVLVQVRGQNSNTEGSSSCGGVLELSSGVLDFSPVGQNGQTPDFCIWVIKLPTNSQKIQFQLTQIPPSSQLNLYPQDGHTAGAFSILPIASLTTSDFNSVVDTKSSSLIAIWTPSRVKNENGHEESSGLLSFTWDESIAQSPIQNGEDGIQTRDLDLVGGVSYVETDQGRFSWAKPGKSQQTLLWVLNSKSPEPLDLKIETEFEKCALVDPCLCSYFGVYEVYENSLRAVSSECGRSSNVELRGIRPRLVALGFVNPEFRQDTNHVTLTWKGEEPEEGTTTTTTTTTTTEQPSKCSSASGFPKSCSEIQFESGSNSSQLQNCLIFPDGPDGDSLEVLCDFETEYGGWTIIQKRSSGPKEEFKQNWNEYANGFGSLSGNFWIGLENIHALTKNGDQELRIDLEDFEGEKKYAKYSNFSISNASDFYQLALGRISGDSTLENSFHQQKFTTIDKDNDHDDDDWSNWNCAVTSGGGGGWWYYNCGFSNLNGGYFEKEETVPARQGIRWDSWKGEYYSMAKTEMKIRKRKP